jgi:hypothetical protein
VIEQRKTIANGRTFVSITESTLDHDIHFMGMLKRYGLGLLRERPGESPDDFADRFLNEILTNGATFDLLGALFIPEGTSGLAWTPQLGAETADQFRKVTSEDEKREVRALIASLVLDFSARGLITFGRSSNESGTEAEARSEQSAQHQPTTSATASGEASSASSPDSITNGQSG